MWLLARSRNAVASAPIKTSPATEGARLGRPLSVITPTTVRRAPPWHIRPDAHDTATSPDVQRATRNPRRRTRGVHTFDLVETMGLEPTTPCLQTGIARSRYQRLREKGLLSGSLS